MKKLARFLTMALAKKRAAAQVTDVSFAELLTNEFELPEDQPREAHARSFYPSDSKYACRRARAYRFLAAPSNPTRKDARLAMTFLIGNAVHVPIQDLLKKIATEAGATFEAEVRLGRETNPWFVSGRMDGVWQSANEDFKRVMDIKTISQDGFTRLYSGPKPEHVHQINSYLGLSNHPVGHYLYVGKNSSGIKEFHRVFDKDQFVETMSEIEQVLLTLKDGELPDRITPTCHDVGCRYRDVCWKAEYTVETLADQQSTQELTQFVPVFVKSRTS